MAKKNYLIDENDELDLIDMDAQDIPRERRRFMVDGGLQMMRENGYPISEMLLRLSEDYVEGRITFAQLNRALLHDQLH